MAFLVQSMQHKKGYYAVNSLCNLFGYFNIVLPGSMRAKSLLYSSANSRAKRNNKFLLLEQLVTTPHECSAATYTCNGQCAGLQITWAH